MGKIEVASPGFTYLQRARIWVMGLTGLRKLTCCVLDAGSQSSFVAKTLIDDLKLEVVDRPCQTAGSVGRTHSKTDRVAGRRSRRGAHRTENTRRDT